MRKLLSVLLVAMLIFSVLPTEGIKANAASEALTLNQLKSVTVTEEQTAVLKFTPSVTGYYSLNSFSNDDLYCTLYKGTEEIAFNDDGGELRDFCLKAKLQAGVTYTYEIGIFYGSSSNASVKLEEAAYVTDIQIAKAPDNTTYLKGYVEDYFSYEGLELMLTLSDGSKFLWRCSEDFAWDMFDMTVDASESDTTGNATLQIDDASCTLPLNILNKTVKSIEVIDDNFAPLEEGVQGVWSYDEDYNDVFYYYSDYCDLGLKVNYSDGSTDTIGSIEDPICGIYYAYADDNQFEQEWSVNGTKNTLTVEFLNAKVKYNVQIVENPVKSITVNSAPTRQYVYGDLNYGESFYGEYFFYPDDLTGLKFTVNFKNGTKKSYTYNNIDLSDYTVDGYAISFDCDYFAEPGKVPVTLNYRGCTTEYNVTLKDSGVSKVEITKAPTLTQLKNYYFSADYLGAQFKITYKNGTSKTVTVTDANSEYAYDPDFGEVGVNVSVDGYIARFYTEYDYEYGCTTILSYLGASCIKEDLIKLEESGFKNVNVTEFSPDGKMTVEVTLQDGSEKTLDIIPKTKTREDFGNFVETTVTASTELGTVNYCFTMYENNIGVFELALFDKYFNFEFTAEKGDFDFNGKVELLDVVMLAQYCAEWDITCDGSAMNINGDSSTDLLDVVYLAQYVAEWQGVELK